MKAALLWIAPVSSHTPDRLYSITSRCFIIGSDSIRACTFSAQSSSLHRSHDLHKIGGRPPLYVAAGRTVHGPAPGHDAKRHHRAGDDPVRVRWGAGGSGRVLNGGAAQVVGAAKPPANQGRFAEARRSSRYQREFFVVCSDCQLLQQTWMHDHTGRRFGDVKFGGEYCCCHDLILPFRG